MYEVMATDHCGESSTAGNSDTPVVDAHYIVRSLTGAYYSGVVSKEGSSARPNAQEDRMDEGLRRLVVAVAVMAALVLALILSVGLFMAVMMAGMIGSGMGGTMGHMGGGGTNGLIGMSVMALVLLLILGGVAVLIVWALRQPVRQ